MTPWEIKAKEFANCNCAYGCPCQFNALPTNGYCEAAVAMEIEQGHYGDVKLDGLRIGGIYQWPGAVHEGRGKCQPFVDERADAKQREALLKIMTGQDTAPMATMFAVYFSTLEKVYDPIFAPIEFEVDVEARKGRYVVAGLIESQRRADQEPGDRSGDPGAYRSAGRLRIRDRRDRQRHHQDAGQRHPRSEGQLRPVRPPAPQQPRRGAAPHGLRCRPKTHR